MAAPDQLNGELAKKVGFRAELTSLMLCARNEPGARAGGWMTIQEIGARLRLRGQLTMVSIALIRLETAGAIERRTIPTPPDGPDRIEYRVICPD